MARSDKQLERYEELTGGVGEIFIIFDDNSKGGLDFEVDNCVFTWFLYYENKELLFKDIDKAWVYPIFHGFSLKDLKKKGMF